MAQRFHIDTTCLCCGGCVHAKKVSESKVLRVDNLGDSGIDMEILGDTDPSRHWDVMGELCLRMKRTFDEEGIEIPWPHTEIYFGNSLPRAE